MGHQCCRLNSRYYLQCQLIPLLLIFGIRLDWSRTLSCCLWVIGSRNSTSKEKIVYLTKCSTYTTEFPNLSILQGDGKRSSFMADHRSFTPSSTSSPFLWREVFFPRVVLACLLPVARKCDCFGELSTEPRTLKREVAECFLQSFTLWVVTREQFIQLERAIRWYRARWLESAPQFHISNLLSTRPSYSS